MLVGIVALHQTGADHAWVCKSIIEEGSPPLVGGIAGVSGECNPGWIFEELDSPWQV